MLNYEIYGCYDKVIKIILKHFFGQQKPFQQFCIVYKTQGTQKLTKDIETESELLAQI